MNGVPRVRKLNMARATAGDAAGFGMHNIKVVHLFMLYMMVYDANGKQLLHDERPALLCVSYCHNYIYSEGVFAN